jgi:hypothetical protein
MHSTVAKRSLSARLILAALAAACSSTDRVTAPTTKPEFAISDAVHEGGTPGFYFLPPVVRQPTFAGTFDAGQLDNLRVTVCDLTSGGCPIEFPSTDIKLAPPEQQYQVNWKTSGLTAGHLYELVVATRTHPQTLGWVDVLLTDRSGTVPALNDVYITQAGRTIPIKFRIEQGAVTTPPPFVITGIHGIQSFLEHCPTTDPAYAQITQDFELLQDGQPTQPIACSEPFSALPIDQLTDELIARQVLRTAYYMSPGTEGKLPWTPKSLYAWMTSIVDGIYL